MRSELVRIYKVVHTWTGILSGMALFIAFYAGAITLFKQPLVHWATPPASASAIPLAQTPTLIQRTLASHPEATRSFELDVRGDAAHALEWTRHEPHADEHDALSVRHFMATLEADGTVRSREVPRSHLGELIDVLHRVVGLPVDSDANRYLMGVVASLYFMALFSGFVVLLPSMLKDLFAFRVGPNLKRMWLDAHNIVGLGSFPFHVVIALTATVFAFHDAIYAAQDMLVHDGKLGALLRGDAAPPEKQPLDPAKLLAPDQLVARITAVAPDLELTTLRYMRVTGPSPTVFAFGHNPRALEFRALGGVIMIDPYSGRIQNTAYVPGQQGVPETVLTSAFALHFGSFGGAPVKWLYFVLGLLGAWLVYSGNLLWIESRGRKLKPHVAGGALPEQRRGVRLMAAATVGVCLGAVCGISLTIVCAKWLHGHVGDLNAWHRGVYYAAFFAAIAWSFLRGGARAAVELLRVAAGLTMAIPLTSLVAALAPSLGMWTHTEPAALAVDGIASIIAFGLLRVARATAKRVYEGRLDSVWSAPRATSSEAPDAATQAMP
ncbi:MAG TPA: PepSY-associated TM helix domain-containing protein [Polyangiales bacterium]|nr:PepSY-associated TM helix domain-containing protein [Polyangiales bacterium]